MKQKTVLNPNHTCDSLAEGFWASKWHTCHSYIAGLLQRTNWTINSGNSHANKRIYNLPTFEMQRIGHIQHTQDF